jgi:hypothetical protein
MISYFKVNPLSIQEIVSHSPMSVHNKNDDDDIIYVGAKSTNLLVILTSTGEVFPFSTYVSEYEL